MMRVMKRASPALSNNWGGLLLVMVLWLAPLPGFCGHNDPTRYFG